jgi:hypothetical protein
VAERVFWRDLVTSESARRGGATANAVKLKHSTEYLAHDFRRQLDAKRAGDSVAGQVTSLGFAIHVNGRWVREDIGLSGCSVPMSEQEHARE